MDKVRDQTRSFREGNMLGSVSVMLREWFYGDYEAEKLEAERSVVARFARGNVLVQDARYLNQSGLEALAKDGDEALRRLQHCDS